MKDLEDARRIQIGQTWLEIVLGDIVQQDVDAIVNAANSSLLGGGGVDGAIHRAAGPQLLEETRKLGGCPTGEARLTRGYNLKARYVIHAVGPIYQPGSPHNAALLASAYRSSLELAVQHDLRSLAFPSISTGAYGYPVEEAAPIALQTVCDFIAAPTSIECVRFVLFNAPVLVVYTRALHTIMSQRADSKPA